MSIPIGFFFLFKVTRINGVRVWPTAVWIPPTLLFVFLILFPLLFTFLFLFFGWHIILFLVFCRTQLPAYTENCMVKSMLCITEDIQTKHLAQEKLKIRIKINHRYNIYLDSFLVCFLFTFSKYWLWRERASPVWKLSLFSQSNSKKSSHRQWIIEKFRGPRNHNSH